MTSAFDNQTQMMTGAQNVGPGWHPILRDLEAVLNQIDPDFTLQQVKEKFGGLRYYANTQIEDKDEQEQFHTEIRMAEERSVRTCEECGKPAETHSSHGWLHTLCDEHLAVLNKRREKELDDLHTNHGGEG